MVNKSPFYLNEDLQFKAKYAGAPGYKNDTHYECIANKGPLPRGKYRIVGQHFKHPPAGKFTLRLQPYASNNMCGERASRSMATVTSILVRSQRVVLFWIQD